MCDPCSIPCCTPCGPCGPCNPCGPCGPCDPCCTPFEPKSCRSRELRCGIMYTTCECVKRNGLQDKCPRSQCQGRSGCMNMPTPNCCPATYPLRFANMTMGVNNKRSAGGSCGGGGACGSCSPPSCNAVSNPGYDCANCGPSNPQFGAPSAIPCTPSPAFCPPMPETGIPDPRVWNSCNTPQQYPCAL